MDVSFKYIPKLPNNIDPKLSKPPTSKYASGEMITLNKTILVKAIEEDEKHTKNMDIIIKIAMAVIILLSAAAFVTALFFIPHVVVAVGLGVFAATATGFAIFEIYSSKVSQEEYDRRVHHNRLKEAVNNVKSGETIRIDTSGNWGFLVELNENLKKNKK
jgi:hypothetical protein